MNPLLLYCFDKNLCCKLILTSFENLVNLTHFLGDKLSTNDASPPGQLVGEVDDLRQGEGSSHRALQRVTQDSSN